MNEDDVLVAVFDVTAEIVAVVDVFAVVAVVE